ncbi:MAG: right-handed parallel beta-helix repeat-containing protein, partial [Candidatus Saccharimonadales bacterium]
LGIAPGVGDIIANPLFVDAKREDFRLKKNSPAIGKGIPVGYKWDINHRRIHGRPDMGAYEHG